MNAATVARTAADGDILLQDGKTLRLAGLQPGTFPSGAAPGPGHRVAFGLISDEPDRWGRNAAIVFTELPGRGWTLLQEAAIAGGARVRPEAGLGECLALLSRMEAKANPAPHGEAGRFDRVEARVQRIGEGRSALFIWLPNQGAIRTMGVVQRRHLARFAGSGVDVRALTGKTIRMRGVRNVRNAAAISLVAPEQIEIVR